MVEDTHMELGRAESFSALDADRDWLRWAAKVEQLLGHDLDGDERIDGFSIDFALEEFANGMTPEAYAAMVRSRPAYHGPSDGPPDEPPAPGQRGPCPGHEWAYTGTAYGGDDESYFGEGRAYCIHCGADGDA